MNKFQVITGFCQGFYFPSVYVLYSQVIPDAGRKTIATGRIAAAIPGAVAVTYYVASQMSSWRLAVGVFQKCSQRKETKYLEIETKYLVFSINCFDTVGVDTVV